MAEQNLKVIHGAKKTSTGNNTGYQVGIFRDYDGTFTALTANASKSYKTLRGAQGFMKRMGYKVVGYFDNESDKVVS